VNDPYDREGAPAHALLRFALALFDYYLFVPLCAAVVVAALNAFRLGMHRENALSLAGLFVAAGSMTSVLVWNVRYARETLKEGVPREPWYWYAAILAVGAMLAIVWSFLLLMFYGDVFKTGA
jgi:hypothetical protein